MTGATDRRMASSAVCFEPCETSTMMPSRFMRAIASAPSALTPVIGLRGIAELRAGARRAREVVVAIMDEPHVARAKRVVPFEQPEIAAQREAVLDADGGDELAAGGDARDVCGAVGDLDAIRIDLVGHATDGIELRHRVGLRCA